MIKKYINPYYSNLEIEDIKENILQEYLLSLADKKLSTNTIKLIWRIIESTIKENKLNINLEEIVVPLLRIRIKMLIRIFLMITK